MILFPKSFERVHMRLVQAVASLASAAMIAGCGAGYRPVVTPINPSGPAAQPTSLLAVVSAPSPTTPGIATIIDYAGDTIVAQAPIGPGPISFTVDAAGTSGYTVNSDGTLTNFQVASSLQAKNIIYLTLPPSAQPLNLFSPSAGLWVSDLSSNVTDLFSGAPLTYKLSIPLAPTPISVVGPSVIGQHNYAITQGSVASGVACNTAPTGGALGEADSIEVASNTVSARIPLGKCPVYALQSPDNRRLFVMNRGDDTITVINSQNNTLDACTPFLNQNGQTVTCHPTLPLSTTAVTATGITPPNGMTGMTATAGPVYAEYIPALSELVIADYDGGTISVIDVSLDEFGNDSQTFGTTYTIPVGTNPASVTALYDGSRAYTANQNDSTVTIVNLTSHSVEKTLPVNGHPRTVVSTQNSLYGKVYVASPDSPYLTILRTDQDIVDTTLLVEGNIVDIRASTQNGVSGNAINVSRKPGYGQPCYLPPSLLTNATLTASPASCWTLPVAP